MKDALSIAEPPFPNDGGMIIPADPELYRLAHESATTMLDEIGVFFEGMTVTRDGDGMDAEISTAFPGALAADDTAYVMGLIGLSRGVPCLVIQSLTEMTPQAPARNEACRLAVKVAEILCRRR